VSLYSAAVWPCAGWDAWCNAVRQRTDKSTRIIARATAALQQSRWLLSVSVGHLCRLQLAHHGPHAPELQIYEDLGLSGLSTFSTILWLDHRPTGETQSPNGQPCMLGDLCTHQLEVPVPRLLQQGEPPSLRLSLQGSK